MFIYRYIFLLYIHINDFKKTCTFVCSYSDIHTYALLWIYTHIHIHTEINVHTPTFTYVYTFPHIHTIMVTDIYECMSVYLCVYIYIYIYTIHINVYIPFSNINHFLEDSGNKNASIYNCLSEWIFLHYLLVTFLWLTILCVGGGTLVVSVGVFVCLYVSLSYYLCPWKKN